jgi:hypothetical protein
LLSQVVRKSFLDIATIHHLYLLREAKHEGNIQTKEI